MDAFTVRGGRPLIGDVRVSGAKNSALKLLAAALLAEGRSTIENVPAIADMDAMADVVSFLGCDVDRSVPGQFTLTVPSELATETPAHLVSRLRASIVVLGPLVARQGRAHLAMPGGCNLGSRNIDLHLAGLAKMGADVHYGPDYVEARAERLHGAKIELPFASVGATENLLLAAVTARGETRIVNAAREPEIADLAAYLTAMGAKISGVGTSELVVSGVDELVAAPHRVVGDRIEAGTFAVGAAMTGGDVTLHGVDPEHLRLALTKMEQAGVEISGTAESGLRVRAAGALRAVDVVTLPYPGFPTDLQAQFLAMLSQAGGTAMVTENVFDGRFSIVPELVRMGAEINLEAHHAIVRGPRTLRGAQVRATDLRAGAALVLAGLVAHGTTTVCDPYHVDRGYADFAARLRALGGNVERADVPDGPDEDEEALTAVSA
jgi:UDP-N-acetylglucosamine 1-carboxyvinyltransferase